MAVAKSIDWVSKCEYPVIVGVYYVVVFACFGQGTLKLGLFALWVDGFMVRWGLFYFYFSFMVYGLCFGVY